MFVTVLPPLATVVFGLLLNAKVSSLWAIPFFVFIPFFLVAILPRKLAARQKFVVPLVMAVYGTTLLALAPSIRERAMQRARGNSTTPVEAIADVVQTRWRAATTKPLMIVAGDNMVANAVSFYASDRPQAIQQSSLKLTPWITEDDIEKAGGTYICVLTPIDACRETVVNLFGRIDGEEAMQVPAMKGAGRPPYWEATLLMRYPGR